MTTTQIKKRRRSEQETSTPGEVTPEATSTEVVAATDKLLSDIDAILAEVEEEIRAHAEATEETKPFTLADAIREGAAVTDQAIGAWTTPKGETCALSAAYLAVKARGLA